MVDKEKREKPKYETPVVVPLGGLAHGIGNCRAGSSPSEDCTAGSAAGSYCTAGVLPATACTEGTGLA
jgi:hypothetical protein